MDLIFASFCNIFKEIDEEFKFVTGQNQNAGHETPQKMMEILKSK